MTGSLSELQIPLLDTVDTVKHGKVDNYFNHFMVKE